MGRSKLPFKRGTTTVLKKPLVVWKKIIVEGGRRAVAKLLVPKGARVVVPYRDTSSGFQFEYKFRVDRAKVLEIVECPGKDEWSHTRRERFKKGQSLGLGGAHQIFYVKGRHVKSTQPVDTNPSQSCGSGIHVFPTKKIAYDFKRY
jgi:hypothetical protein